jgi:hypothetical protein
LRRIGQGIDDAIAGQRKDGESGGFGTAVMLG